MTFNKEFTQPAPHRCFRIFVIQPTQPFNDPAAAVEVLEIEGKKFFVATKGAPQAPNNSTFVLNLILTEKITNGVIYMQNINEDYLR